MHLIFILIVLCLALTYSRKPLASRRLHARNSAKRSWGGSVHRTLLFKGQHAFSALQLCISHIPLNYWVQGSCIYFSNNCTHIKWRCNSTTACLVQARCDVWFLTHGVQKGWSIQFSLYQMLFFISIAVHWIKPDKQAGGAWQHR